MVRARQKRALVLNFGVAVNAKKLRFGCLARCSALRNTASFTSLERSSSSSSESWAAIAASIPSLFNIPLRSLAVSPLWEECASSTMTAKRFPAVSIFTPIPFFSRVESACEMKGNFWIVVMTMGVPWDSARASCLVSSSIFSTTPVLCSNW